jgi:acetyl-CoA carboxylase carboxyl transferase subunit alpha
MKEFGLVDGIIPEPAGGAHWDYMEAAQILKEYLVKVLQELKPIAPEERINQRIEKFGKMGFWQEVSENAPAQFQGKTN